MESCWNDRQKPKEFILFTLLHLLQIKVGYCKKTNGLFQNERYQAYDKFSGKPIDGKLYSLLPDNLSEKFKNKLVNISLEILKNDPEYTIK